MMIKLNNKPYRLQFDFNAVCDIEDVLNCSITKILDNEKNIGYKAMRAFLWGGIKKYNPNVTIEQVGDLITIEQKRRPDRIEELFDQVFKAMQQDGLFGKNEEDQATFDDQETKSTSKAKKK